MTEAVIISLITAGIPALVTIITSIVTNRESRMHAAKQSIMQMILEDNVRVLQHKLPENYQLIHKEYDAYHKNGGNSYIKAKVEDFDNWYKSIYKNNNI